MVRIGTIALVAVGTILLFAASDLSLGRLRALEIVLFVAVSAHILVLDHGQLLREAAAGDAGLVLSRWNLTALSFVLLMATYAIFVPNTWARAAAVIVPLGAAPIALGVLVRARHPEVRLLTQSVLTASKITDVVFLLSIAVIVSILGVLLIDRFRSVAIDARSANTYDLQERIGQGGMGEVWLAQHQTLARPAAIKIIRPELLSDGDKDSTKMATRRFEREARATAGLRSPNTVEIYDFGITNEGVFYYVMEYLEGLDLETLVKRFGPFGITDDDEPCGDLIHELNVPGRDVHFDFTALGQFVDPLSLGVKTDGFRIQPRDQRADRVGIDQKTSFPTSGQIGRITNDEVDVFDSNVIALHSDCLSRFQQRRRGDVVGRGAAPACEKCTERIAHPAEAQDRGHGAAGHRCQPRNVIRRLPTKCRNESSACAARSMSMHCTISSANSRPPRLGVTPAAKMASIRRCL